MNNFMYSITVFDNIIDEVSVRLGHCQSYGEKISTQVLLDNGVDIDNGHLNFFQVLKLAKKRQEMEVSFYCIQANKQFLIYSDFFNLDGAFFDAFSFFDDINSVFMMCEIKETTINASLIKFGKVLFQFEINDYIRKSVNDILSKKYVGLCDTIQGMPNTDDIAESIGFIIQNYSKTDEQMQKYLLNNSLFHDEYIL